MTVKKYSLLTILLYVFAFFAPIIAPTQQLNIKMTTFTYLLGAALMFLFYLFQKEILSFERHKSKIAVTFIIGIIGIFLAIYLQAAIIKIEQSNNIPVQSQNTTNIIKIISKQPFFALAAMVGGPIMEEFVFRRAVVGFFDSFNHPWIGMIVSSLLFALIHQDGHLLLYFSLGFFFCLLYRKTGRIATSIITHVGMNSFVVLANVILPLFT
ncbi:MAG TPA: type II CAAX endopeptidase family protein [Tetragenococcus sp.]|nr:type II CAAX endopeptidase family protein [Tetragenococcus sp.]